MFSIMPLKGRFHQNNQAVYLAAVSIIELTLFNALTLTCWSDDFEDIAMMKVFYGKCFEEDCFYEEESSQLS